MANKDILFPGRLLFKMKDEQGLPLDFAVALILDEGIAIDWPDFIDTARSCKWWDFQTIKVMQEVLFDAADRDYCDEVIKRAKLYMLANPHPAMKNVKD